MFHLANCMRILSAQYGAIFVVTNQVTGDFNGADAGVASSSSAHKPALGLSWANCINQRCVSLLNEQGVTFSWLTACLLTRSLQPPDPAQRRCVPPADGGRLLAAAATLARLLRDHERRCPQPNRRPVTARESSGWLAGWQRPFRANSPRPLGSDGSTPCRIERHLLGRFSGTRSAKRHAILLLWKADGGKQLEICMVQDLAGNAILAPTAELP
jgi:hypothetical protein